MKGDIFEHLTEEELSCRLSNLTYDEIGDILEHRKLSENFIENNWDYLDTDLVCLYQELSENFMRKHIDKINMEIISYSQELSDDFIVDFFDELSFDDIVEFQHPGPSALKYIRKKRFFASL